MTVGFAKELYFIAKTLGKNLTSDLKTDPWNTIRFEVNPLGLMTIYFNGTKIWIESLDESEFFGVESVDSIFRIIACIQNKDSTWPSKYPSPEKL